MIYTANEAWKQIVADSKAAGLDTSKIWPLLMVQGLTMNGFGISVPYAGLSAEEKKYIDAAYKDNLWQIAANGTDENVKVAAGAAGVFAKWVPGAYGQYVLRWSREAIIQYLLPSWIVGAAQLAQGSFVYGVTIDQFPEFYVNPQLQIGPLFYQHYPFVDISRSDIQKLISDSSYTLDETMGGIAMSLGLNIPGLTDTGIGNRWLNDRNMQFKQAHSGGDIWDKIAMAGVGIVLGIAASQIFSALQSAFGAQATTVEAGGFSVPDGAALDSSTVAQTFPVTPPDTIPTAPLPDAPVYDTIPNPNEFVGPPDNLAQLPQTVTTPADAANVVKNIMNSMNISDVAKAAGIFTSLYSVANGIATKKPNAPLTYSQIPVTNVSARPGISAQSFILPFLALSAIYFLGKG